MRRLMLLALVPLLFIVPSWAVLTKTTSRDVVDAWQIVTASTSTVGNAEDVSGNYGTILYVETALVENNPTAHSGGPLIIVEVSYGDDEWVELARARGPDDNGIGTLLSGEHTAGSTTLTVDSAASGNFPTPGIKIFIQDGTIANSESVRIKSVADPNITLCHDTLNTHADNTNVRDNVSEWLFSVPLQAAQVRVTAVNQDTDCDFAFTTRVSKVTAL